MSNCSDDATSNINLHNHGFVELVDVLGSDESIENAARVSYAKGTRQVSDSRNLIRYLVRHNHTSPLEMAEVIFHIKMPIFVMRQLVRHRTANLNEVSFRYSVVPDEFYYPTLEYTEYQSKDNKQGRTGQVDAAIYENWIAQLKTECERTREVYDYGITNGIARELCRIGIPVNQYTECYWKCDLRNFTHMLQLRMDSHAQREIRDYANAMYKLAKPHFPLVFEAWEDYKLNSISLSSMETVALHDLCRGQLVHDRLYYKMSEREWKEFVSRWVPGGSSSSRSATQ